MKFSIIFCWRIVCLKSVTNYHHISHYIPDSYIHTHTYFICHKLSIVEYVDSNGRLPEKLVLIVLAAHYYIYNKYCSRTTHIHTHTQQENETKEEERKKRQTEA